jgi:hypothetical protein
MYDYSRLAGLRPPRKIDKTMIPAAYEVYREKVNSDLGEITDKQWGVIEMLVDLHRQLLEHPYLPDKKRLIVIGEYNIGNSIIRRLKDDPSFNRELIGNEDALRRYLQQNYRFEIEFPKWLAEFIIENW